MDEWLALILVMAILGAWMMVGYFVTVYWPSREDHSLEEVHDNREIR